MTLFALKRTISAAAASILTWFHFGSNAPTTTGVAQLQPVTEIQSTQPVAAVKSTKRVVAKKATQSEVTLTVGKPVVAPVEMKEYTYLFAGKVMCGNDICMDATEMRLILDVEGMPSYERKALADKEGTYMVRISFVAPVKANMNWTIKANNPVARMATQGTEKLLTNKVAIENLMDLKSQHVETQKIIA